ncbi:MAG: RagB/SusD family nutrient uptake outer membrane protein [Chitinophagaceae bacterium]|nr:RagB/SusD family nutrient uptake outer membrane protein [Chitinophagaceae bacterium]
MKKLIFNSSAIFGLVALLALSSCLKHPNELPTNDVTSETVYATPAGYKQVLAKVYGSFALTGNSGPAGNGDVQGIDEGFSDFYRLFWKAQELSTDEAVISWGDVGIQDFHRMNWTSNNSFLTGLYYRSMYQITLCNEFIRQAADDKLSARGISGGEADNIRQYAREARFLRAFQYWVLMDLYGNPPFATETTTIGGAPPPQAKRSEIFTYIESELKALETNPNMPGARANEYGRVDKAAVWALLARLYLNAQVYNQDPVTGTPGPERFSDAATYAKNVIDAGYSLVTNYPWLMRADNDLNKSEFIFTINYDGLRTQGYGGTTFLSHACVGGSMPASTFGIAGGWSGTRTTKNLPALFPDVTGTADKRAQFYTTGQSLEIGDLTAFIDGYAVTKYRNVKRDGSAGSSQDFSDIDMPLFRLPEMYLIYAESVIRKPAAGNAATALGYINKMRGRAYANDPNSTAGNISSGEMTLDFILDERARELYWEGFRRTDLIRYNRFTEGAYLWPWKGGVSSGTGVASYRKLYPIPSRDLNSNTNLVQNPGY